MDEIDLKGFLNGLNETKVDGSLLQMCKELTTTLNAAKTTLKEGADIVKLLDQMGLKTLLVRAAGKKLDVDPETPLKSENTVTTRSEEHKILFNELNKLDTNQLSELVAQMYTQKSPSQEKPKK